MNIIMSPYDTVNKMAGAKVANEETIAPWAPGESENIFTLDAQAPVPGRASSCSSPRACSQAKPVPT